MLFASILLYFLFRPNPEIRAEFKRTFQLTRNEKWLLVLGGALEGAHYVFYFYAPYYTSAIAISILVNVGELFVAISGFLFFGEVFTKKFGLAILAALLGILVIVTGGDFTQIGTIFNSESALGDFLIIISAFLFSLYAVIKKKLIKKTGSIPLIVITFFIGQLTLFPFTIPAIIDSVNYSSLAWIFLIIMAVFGSALGYFAFAQGIKHTDMSIAGIITLSSPIFAIIFSLLLVPGENLDWASGLGAVLIILSIFLTSSPAKSSNKSPKSLEEEKKCN